jgi:uncharacterized protein
LHAIVAAALAGLLATPHCAGMCGGFAMACARPSVSRARASLPVLTPGLWGWHAGRLTTYAALGMIAGAFGRVLPGPSWVPAVLSAVLLVWFAAALAGLVGAPARSVPGLARLGALLAGRTHLAGRWLFGAVTGLLPCGMVYAALGIAVAAAHPLHGGLAMLAFGAATVPGLTVLGAGVRRIAAQGLWARRALAAVVLVVGLWAVAARGFAPHSTHTETGPAAAHAH